MPIARVTLPGGETVPAPGQGTWKMGEQSSPAQIAPAWMLAQPQTIAIPKAGSDLHVRDNRAAADIALTPDDMAALDAVFPPPRRKSSLEML